MRIASGNVHAMSDGDDDSSTASTASAVNTPPESVVNEVDEELARVRMQIEKIRKLSNNLNQEIVAKRRWFHLGLGVTNMLASAALALCFVLTVMVATRYFDAAAVTTQPSMIFPIPGSVYMIRSTISSQKAWSGSVMTHLDDKVLLTKITDGRSHWLVVEKNGWLGFLNAQSGRLLGHGTFNKLRCTARDHNEWERFHFQPGGRQGQILLMTHWGRLVPVVVSLHDGKAALSMLSDGIAGGEVWEFVKVRG